MRFTVDRLDHVVVNCADVDESAAWYQRVLGMEREMFGPDNRTALKFGGQKLNLRPQGHKAEAWVTAAHAAAGAMDLCFVTAVRVGDVVAHLQECGVEVESGPVPKQGALGAIQSVYCRDPDGNLIEIASYLSR